MDLPVANAQAVSDYFRTVLTEILEELVGDVPDGYTSRTEIVQQSLRNISNYYKNGLRFANSNLRSDWNDPANRCAYVFLYLMHHCYLVYGSLQHSDEVTRSWRNKSSLKVCSIGGGPGSDLVGLTTFLRFHGIFPPSLECLVLDLYPNWKQTWDVIYNHLPETFSVTYRKCDLVKDTRLQTHDLQFVKGADILTFSKSFSAVSAFYRAHQAKGNFLREVLQETKPGCFVLYIDNECGGTDQFQRDFTSRAGMELVFEFRGTPTFPKGPYSHTIRKYHRLFDYSSMRSCNVTIQLFRKKGAVQPRRAEVISSSSRGSTSRNDLIYYGSSDYSREITVKNTVTPRAAPRQNPQGTPRAASHSAFPTNIYGSDNSREITVKKKRAPPAPSPQNPQGTPRAASHSAFPTNIYGSDNSREITVKKKRAPPAPSPQNPQGTPRAASISRAAFPPNIQPYMYTDHDTEYTSHQQASRRTETNAQRYPAIDEMRHHHDERETASRKNCCPGACTIL